MYWTINKRTLFAALLFLCTFQWTKAQVNGQITDTEQTPISYASIQVANSPYNAVANEEGKYELNLPAYGTYELVIHQTGFNPKVITLNYEGAITKNVALDAVTAFNVEKTNNPAASKALAKEVILQAIAHKLENGKQSRGTETSFYSRGSIQGVAHPKKFLGYKIEQLDPSLRVDSLRNKYLYTSETQSTVVQNSKSNYKEQVSAHTTTGSKNGIGFDTNWSSNFDFYNDIALTDWKLVSPLSNAGFAYYDYEVVEQFNDTWSGKDIYKIQVTPKRPTAPVIEGFIYIVDTTWEIFAIDAYVLGKNVELPKISQLQIRQHFFYNKSEKRWVKNHQLLDFDGSILVFKYKGNYIYHYQNQATDQKWPKNTFSNEVISFDAQAQSIDETYWNNGRPIPLSELEQEDHTMNKAFEALKSTRVYQDSIDKVHNKFNLFKLIQGYKYRISHKNETITYNGLLSTFAFNPVQGFNVTTGLWYTKDNPVRESFYSFGGLVNYGTADNKPRLSGFYTHLFNKVDYAKLNVTGGTVVHQYGEDFPIKKLINSIAASWFGNNFAKFYQKDFVRVQYEQEITNGLFGKIDLEYANRIPLYNTKEHSPFIKDKMFSSNNPLDPRDFTSAGFEENHLMKLKLNAVINFKQEYIRYPNKKINLADNTYPVVFLNYEKGFAGSDEKYNYDLIGFSSKYQSSLGVVGNLGMYVNAGYFMNAEDIAFMDYKHFYGNETFIGTTKDYLQNFNLLPYYNRSTNKSFVETHIEHNFKGFMTNRVPLFDQLQWHLVVGAHALHVNGAKPYYEASIGFDNFGFGKFRPFRIDYIHSFDGGKQSSGVVLGIKFLNNMQ